MIIFRALRSAGIRLACRPGGAAAAAGVVAVVAAAAAWLSFRGDGLVLSHYDARAHLVVARRIVDSITPGWQQIGGVWLPLPHLLHALPAQVDALYRTGLFASLVSIGCFGVTTYAVVRLVLLATGSALGAAVAAALLVLNPNLLYLHATPLTEPLLLALMFLVVLWLCEWVPRNEARIPVRLRAVLVAAAWTRYEAWPVLAAAIGAAIWAASRTGASRAAVARRGARLAVWPASAVVLFMAMNRAMTGEWLTTGGFYERDPFYEGRLQTAVLGVWWGTHRLTTRTTEIVALAGAVFLALRALLRRADAPLLILTAPFASAMLPVYALYQGHPFRIRYMVSLAVACALTSGLAVGYLRRQAPIILAGLLVGVTLLQSPPWWREAPMVVEAQLDAPNRASRRVVTRCLAQEYGGEKVLASMGSLAHYMHELAGEGFNIASFIHEGNGAIWALAMETGPAPHAGWMLVEERSEGGDVLARRLAQDPAFATGMRRACDGGGIALYKRLADPAAGSRVTGPRTASPS